MFAGLPGIGVGTLFYVLTAFWMPVCELPRLLRGESSVARWRLIFTQLLYAFSIIICVMAADFAIGIMLGTRAPVSLSPTRMLGDVMAQQAPQSILAVPVTASLLMLGSVLAVVEIARLIMMMRTPVAKGVLTPSERTRVSTFEVLPRVAQRSASPKQ